MYSLFPDVMDKKRLRLKPVSHSGSAFLEFISDIETSSQGLECISDGNARVLNQTIFRNMSAF